MSMILGGIAMQLLGTLAMSGEVMRRYRIVLSVLLLLLLVKTFAELAAIYTIGFLRFGSFRAFFLSCVVRRLMPRSGCSIPQVTAGAPNYLLACIVQLVFVQRLHVLYRGSYWLVAPLAALAVIGLAFGFVTSAAARNRRDADVAVAYLADIVRADMPFDPTLVSFKWRYLTSVCIPAFIDFAITAAFLAKYRSLAAQSSEQGVSRILRRLVFVTLESNLLTGLFVFMAMILALCDVPMCVLAPRLR